MVLQQSGTTDEGDIRGEKRMNPTQEVCSSQAICAARAQSIQPMVLLARANNVIADSTFELQNGCEADHTLRGRLHDRVKACNSIYRGPDLGSGLLTRAKCGLLLWLSVATLPVLAVCVPWVLLSDFQCGNGKRNFMWYQWVYDVTYLIVALGCGVGLLETLFFSPQVYNWCNEFRCRCYSTSAITYLLLCTAFKVGIESSGLHLTEFVWGLTRLVVVMGITGLLIAVLIFVWRHTRRDDLWKHAVPGFARIFAVFMWCLGWYYSNQIFVAAYVRGQASLLTSSGRAWIWAYDYSVATFFSNVLTPIWSQIGFALVDAVVKASLPEEKGRIYLIMTLWRECFSAHFGRIVFKEVQNGPVLVCLILKDTVARLMDLGWKYKPAQMISFGLMQQSVSGYQRISSKLFSMAFEIDLSLTFASLFGPKFAQHVHGETEFESDHNRCLPLAWGPIPDSQCSMTAHSSAASDCSAACSAGVGETHILNWTVGFQRRTRRSQQERPSNRTSVLQVDFEVLPAAQRSATAHGNTSTCQPTWKSSGLEYEDAIKLIKASFHHCAGQCSQTEAEALVRQMCSVQNNLRLKFVGTYVARVTSSVVGLVFLFVACRYMPCTREAYIAAQYPEFQEALMWSMIALCDVAEAILLTVIHWKQRVIERNTQGQQFVDKVLWHKWLLPAVLGLNAHLLQDAFLSMYKMNF